jgi:hypothetical protein
MMVKKKKKDMYLWVVLNTTIGKMKSVFPAEPSAESRSPGGTETGERVR